MFEWISGYPNKPTQLNSPSFWEQQAGITLLELMTSVAVTSILTVIAVPNMGSFVVQLRVNDEISMLHRLLLITRNSAINSGERAILCPLNSKGKCTTEWHNELSVFIDNNNNQRFDSVNNEKIITTKSPIKADDILIYGKGRTKVTYHPTGHLSGLSNGTFRYCPLNYEHKSRAVIVARSGRTYVSSDVDKDTKDETRMNKEIKCN